MGQREGDGELLMAPHLSIEEAILRAGLLHQAFFQQRPGSGLQAESRSNSA